MTGSRGRPVVIVDTASASAVSPDDLRSALAEATDLERLEWFEADAVGASAHENGRTAAARAVASGAPTVIACGDDSTVRACLEAVAGTSTALGVVSLGPGTLLASNLALAPGLDAVGDAVGASTRRIDVGEANGEVFAVMAGFGVDVMLGRRSDDGGTGGIGAAVAALFSLRRRMVRVTVHVDGVHRHTGRTPCLLVANCPDGPGRVPVVPGADPGDAELDLAVLAPRTVVGWAEALWRLVTGRPQRPAHVVRARGDWAFVQLASARPYELDGDPRPPALRLDVRVWPAALSVRGPDVESAAERVAAEQARAEREAAERAAAEREAAERARAEREAAKRESAERAAAKREAAERARAERAAAKRDAAERAAAEREAAKRAAEEQAAVERAAAEREAAEATGGEAAAVDPVDGAAAEAAPAPSDPAPSDPAPSDPTGTEPTPSDPTGTDPAESDPVEPDSDAPGAPDAEAVPEPTAGAATVRGQARRPPRRPGSRAAVAEDSDPSTN